MGVTQKVLKDTATYHYGVKVMDLPNSASPDSVCSKYTLSTQDGNSFSSYYLVKEKVLSRILP